MANINSMNVGGQLSMIEDTAAREMEANAYDPTQTYAKEDICIYNDKLYEANTVIATPEAFNIAHWTEITLGKIVQKHRDSISQLTENKTLIKSDVFDEYSNIGDFYAVKVGSIIIVQRCTFASKSYTPSLVMAKLKSSYKPLKSMRIPVQLADLENVTLSYLFINEKGEVVSANTFTSNVFCCQFILA